MGRNPWPAALLLAVSLPILGCGSVRSASAPAAAPTPRATPSSGWGIRPAAPGPPERALPAALWTGETTSHVGMVVTGSREASAAGARMLEAGGNAIDAAVAAAFTLGVSEPGSSGLGGQTYMLIRLADGRSVAIDGSCRAPLNATPAEMEILRSRLASMFGYKSVATPGTLAALALALRRYGSMPLGEVLAPAIETAEFGSAWGAGQRSYMDVYVFFLRGSHALSRLFLKDEADPWDASHVYCNPDLACFLRRLAGRGADEFYRGAIAAEIERDMIANGGWLRRGDLGLYEAEVKEPLRGRYRGLEVLSFPHPGGGAGVVEALAILDRFPPERLREDTTDRLHLVLEACRLAHADTSPRYRPPRPPDELATDPAHVAARAALIRADRALFEHEISSDPLSTLEVPGTTQVSVADRWGNVVSLTQTLGNTFGGLVATEGFGFPYNNLVFAFDYWDRRAWKFLTPLQAPFTRMAPTIALKDGKPLLVLGSAGSERIASIIVNTVVNLIDGRRPLCEAITAPRVLWGGFLERQAYLEIFDPITEPQADALKERGFVVQKRLTYPAHAAALAEFGGANAVYIDPEDGTFVGVGDPRRQGVAVAPRDAPPAGARRAVLPGCWRSL